MKGASSCTLETEAKCWSHKWVLSWVLIPGWTMSSGYQCQAVSGAEIAFQVGQPRKNWKNLPLFFKKISSPRPHHLKLGYKGSHPAEATRDGWTLCEGCSYPSIWEVKQTLWAIHLLLLWSNGASGTVDLIYPLSLTIPIHPLQTLHPRGGVCSAAVGFS